MIFWGYCLGVGKICQQEERNEMSNLRENRPALHARVKEYVNQNAELEHLQLTARMNYLGVCFDFAEACLEYWDTALGGELVNMTAQLSETIHEYNAPLNIDDFYRFVLQALDDEEYNTPEHRAYTLQGRMHAHGFSGRVEGLGGQLYGVVFDLPNKLHAVLTDEVLTINKGELLEENIDNLNLEQLEHLEEAERLRLASFVLHWYNNPRTN